MLGLTFFLKKLKAGEENKLGGGGGGGCLIITKNGYDF